MALITVIIPCYNASMFIDKAIKALEKQTRKNFDVILVDDNSDDNTYDMVQNCYINHTSFHLSIIKNDTNIGPSASRLKAALCSVSEYLVFCDSDDWLEPECMAILEENISFSGPELIIYGFNRVFSNGNKKPHLFSYKKEIGIKPSIALTKGVDTLCAISIKRNIFVAVPHADLRHGEDMAILPLLITASTKINIINKALYNYYCRTGSVSHHIGQDVVDSLLDSFHHIESNIPIQYADSLNYLAAKNVLYGVILNLFKYKYDKKQAKRIITNIENKYPYWFENKDICNLGFYKRLFLFFVHKRYFVPIKIMSCIHEVITNS